MRLHWRPWQWVGGLFFGCVPRLVAGSAGTCGRMGDVLRSGGIGEAVGVSGRSSREEHKFVSSRRGIVYGVRQNSRALRCSL